MENTNNKYEDILKDIEKNIRTSKSPEFGNHYTVKFEFKDNNYYASYNNLTGLSEKGSVPECMIFGINKFTKEINWEDEQYFTRGLPNTYTDISKFINYIEEFMEMKDKEEAEVVV